MSTTTTFLPGLTLESAAPLCPRCKERPRPPRKGPNKYHAYCKPCTVVTNRLWQIHNRGQTREYRRSNYKGEVARKHRIRAHARYNFLRGRIQRHHCGIPGCTTKAQMHHPDYDKPLEVEWYCAEHHRALHQRERDEALATA